MSEPALKISYEEQGPAKGRYVGRAPELPEAEMSYSRAGAQLLIIDHTGVPDGLRGKGVGQALVHRAVEDARAGGYRIMPLCPFAKAQFDKNPAYSDVRHK